MKEAAFVATTDLEIGDRVKVRLLHSHTFEIHDIRTVHYFRDMRVEFEFQLKTTNDSEIIKGWFPREEIIYPVKEDHAIGTK